MTDGNPMSDSIPGGQGSTAAAAPERPIFAAVLTPHRSLTSNGFLWLMGLFGGISLMAGVLFLSKGAWPVFGFFGLDVLAIYVAFRVSYRSGRAFEEIAVTRARLSVRKVAPDGRAREFSFNPYWARLEVEHRPEGVVRLAIAHRQERLAIASFLNPDDRESFAKAFAAALATARSVPAA